MIEREYQERTEKNDLQEHLVHFIYLPVSLVTPFVKCSAELSPNFCYVTALATEKNVVENVDSTITTRPFNPANPPRRVAEKNFRDPADASI